MILFIDDEPHYVEVYALELGDAGYKVQLVSDADAALAFIEAYEADVELVILDIMMPPGRALAGAVTNKGRRTGARLYEVLRKPRPNLPFVILTNVSDAEIEQQLGSEPNTRVLLKYECLPHELVEAVEAMKPGRGAR